VLWVIAYFAGRSSQSRADRVTFTLGKTEIRMHPGQWWMVLALASPSAAATCSAASNASFFVGSRRASRSAISLFTYAMGSAPRHFPEVTKTANGLATIT